MHIGSSQIAAGRKQRHITVRVQPSDHRCGASPQSRPSSSQPSGYPPIPRDDVRNDRRLWRTRTGGRPPTLRRFSTSPITSSAERAPPHARSRTTRPHEHHPCRTVRRRIGQSLHVKPPTQMSATCGLRRSGTAAEAGTRSDTYECARWETDWQRDPTGSCASSSQRVSSKRALRAT